MAPVGTLLSLMTQLFVAGAVLIPQSAMALGIEAGVALLSVIQTVEGSRGHPGDLLAQSENAAGWAKRSM